MQRRWAVAFATMFALSLLTAATSFVAITRLVDTFRDAAVRVDRETAETVRLRAMVEEEWNAAHSLVDQQPHSAAGFLAQDRGVAAEFAAAAHVHDTGAQRAILARSRASWAESFTFARRLARQSNRPPASHDPSVVATHMRINVKQTAMRVLLERLQNATRASLRHRLDEAATSRHRLLALLLAAVVASLAAMVFFARRMARDVLGPIRELRDSWRRLGAGQSGERLALHRDDELGELAATFNAMADAIEAEHADVAALARRDVLTGLANRLALAERLDQDAGTGPATPETVLFLDLDDFKRVNDSLGHHAGDELLREVARRLRACTRGDDVLVRVGGDEFAIVLAPGAKRPEDVAERILAEMGRPFAVQGGTVHVGASIGIATDAAASGDDPDAPLRHADAAMYRAKQLGKNRWVVFDPEAHAGDAVGRYAPAPQRA